MDISRKFITKEVGEALQKKGYLKKKSTGLSGVIGKWNKRYFFFV